MFLLFFKSSKRTSFWKEWVSRHCRGGYDHSQRKLFLFFFLLGGWGSSLWPGMLPNHQTPSPFLWTHSHQSTHPSILVWLGVALRLRSSWCYVSRDEGHCAHPWPIKPFLCGSPCCLLSHIPLPAGTANTETTCWRWKEPGPPNHQQNKSCSDQEPLDFYVSKKSSLLC